MGCRAVEYGFVRDAEAGIKTLGRCRQVKSLISCVAASVSLGNTQCRQRRFFRRSMFQKRSKRYAQGCRMAAGA